MTHTEEQTTKQNVQQFDEDVRRTGSYAYTTERLSARLANARISEVIAECFDFRNKAVLDLGCGDGAYTLEFPELGVSKVIGVDPACAAIESARNKARALALEAQVHFEVGDIYAINPLLANAHVDCIVLRGVLHHLPDPANAIRVLSTFRGTVVLMEPNGNNPVLKLLERYSRYHIEHEERSFSPAQIRAWLRSAGFEVRSSRIINLVPFFCPDWMARLLHFVQPFVERLPLVRDIACGQVIMVANK